MHSFSIVNKTLASKLGIYTIIIAVAISALVSAIEVRNQYRQSVTNVITNARQMMELTLHVAAESVYQLDDEIARDLLRSLMQNSLLLESTIVDELGKELARETRPREKISGIASLFKLVPVKLQYDLPVPNDAGQSGSFEAILDLQAGLIPFYDMVIVTATTRLFEAIGISLLVFTAAMYMVTSPLGALAKRFAEIDPGSEKRLVVSKNHHDDELGNLARTANHYLEVTEHYQVELANSEAIYRGILENMADTYFRTDIEGRITMVSASAESLLGHTIDELIGKDITEFYAYPEDRRSFLTQLRDEGEVSEFESLLRNKDGSQLLAETNAHNLFDGEGKMSGVEGVVRNITDRRHTEELNTRLGRIIENSVNEVYVFNSTDLTFNFANQGARKNLGYSMEELSRLTPSDIKPEYTLQEFTHLIQPLRDATLEAVDFETIHRRKDGSLYPVEVRLQYNRFENPPLFFEIIQDITERKQSLQQLSQAHKMEAIGQLTGGISHDFNNLLTIIIGNVELAQSQPDISTETFEFLVRSITAAKKGATLTQRLLAFSRKQALKPEVIDVRVLVSGMDVLMRRTLREDIEIEIVAAGGLWRCEVDPAQLENVLLNLTINASDAMPDGGKLTIETSNAQLDEQFASQHIDVVSGQYVMLAVTDTGVGIAPENISKVFDPFFTTKEEGKGSGLGLSMVYGFVKQSGGSIDIYSEVNEGTTIKIYLPRSRSIVRINREPSSDISQTAGDGEVILVVEDNLDLAMVVAEMLLSLGYVPLNASNVQEAVDIMEAERIDLLLTDVILTDSEKGTDLVKIVSARWPGTRVLYMSGYTENAIIHDGRLDAGIELLSKPFSRQQLARRLLKVLESKRDV